MKRIQMFAKLGALGVLLVLALSFNPWSASAQEPGTRRCCGDPVGCTIIYQQGCKPLCAAQHCGANHPCCASTYCEATDVPPCETE